MTDWRNLITVDPQICHGQPCFAGTRVPVSVVLDNFAAEIPTEEILASYPSLTSDHLRTALAYAAELAKERVLPIPARDASMRFESRVRE